MEPVPEQASKRAEPHLLERVVAALEVVAAAALGSLFLQAVFSLLGIPPQRILEETALLFAFMTGEATLTLLFIGLFLRLRGESFRDLGWNFHNPRPEVLLGLAAVPCLFGATLLVGTFFHLFLPHDVTVTNPLLEMVQTKVDLAFFLISSLYVGGVKEEVQRAFVLVRFESYLGGEVPGLILWSVVFGVLHSLQGVDNAVGAGVLGLIFGVLFVWRRNLISPMIAHALFDIVTLIVYWYWLA